MSVSFIILFALSIYMPVKELILINCFNSQTVRRIVAIAWPILCAWFISLLGRAGIIDKLGYYLALFAATDFAISILILLAMVLKVLGVLTKGIIWFLIPTAIGMLFIYGGIVGLGDDGIGIAEYIKNKNADNIVEVSARYADNHFKWEKDYELEYIYNSRKYTTITDQEGFAGQEVKIKILRDNPARVINNGMPLVWASILLMIMGLMFIVPVVIVICLKWKSYTRQKERESDKTFTLDIKTIRKEALKGMGWWIALMTLLTWYALPFLIIPILGLIGVMPKQESGMIRAAVLVVALCSWGVYGIYRKIKPSIDICRNKFYIVEKECLEKCKVTFDPSRTAKNICNMDFGAGFEGVSGRFFDLVEKGDKCYLVYSEATPAILRQVYSLEKYDVAPELREYDKTVEINRKKQKALEDEFFIYLNPFIERGWVREVCRNITSCVLFFVNGDYILCQYKLRQGNDGCVAPIGTVVNRDTIKKFVEKEFLIEAAIDIMFSNDYEHAFYPFDNEFLDTLDANPELKDEPLKEEPDYKLEEELKAICDRRREDWDGKTLRV